MTEYFVHATWYAIFIAFVAFSICSWASEIVRDESESGFTRFILSLVADLSNLVGFVYTGAFLFWVFGGGLILTIK